MKYILMIVSMFFSGLVQAEIKSQYSTSYYDFEAKDINSLVESIKVKGPKVGNKAVWASITWELNTEFSFSSTSSHCSLVVQSMELVANLALPNWLNIQSQNDELQGWWINYSNFILDHENLHFDNAMASAKGFELKLLEMPEQLTCKEVKLEYLTLKHQFLSGAGMADKQIDIIAKRRFNSNEKLFAPLKSYSNVVFESGGMRSYISM